MTRALLFCVYLAACGGDANRGCPTEPDGYYLGPCTRRVEAGTTCTRIVDDPKALPQDCYCDANGYWECNSCPFFWVPRTQPGAPADGCEPSTTCVINSWEHGCDCACNADRAWRCSPATINSQCPHNALDAGVDGTP